MNEAHSVGAQTLQLLTERGYIQSVSSRVDDPARLLDEVKSFLSRFVVYPAEDCLVAHVLWVAHAHLIESFESTPRLAFLSPEPASGKTRALEITELLVPNPVEAVNVTPAYLFRKVGDEENGPVTILFDEVDTVFGPKAKDNEEIRGLLNAGHRRGAVAGRCVVRGKLVTTEEISAYCAVALAGLGGLPDTLITRAVVIPMRRRAPSESAEPYRRRVHSPEGHALRERLAAWATSIAGKIESSWPQMPKGVKDRDADKWEALLSVADAAGGEWPERARVAAVALVADSKVATPSLGIRLLEDIATVFGDREVMPTTDLLSALHDLEESPWGDLYGKALNARGLAQRLRPYQVSSTNLRIGDHIVKGFKRESFYDPWERYVSRKFKGREEEGSETTVGPPTYETATTATTATASPQSTPNASSFRPCPECGVGVHVHSIHECRAQSC